MRQLARACVLRFKKLSTILIHYVINTHNTHQSTEKGQNVKIVISFNNRIFTGKLSEKKTKKKTALTKMCLAKNSMQQFKQKLTFTATK